MHQAYRFHGRVTPAVKEAQDYLLLPFQVPSGVKRIEVTYAYEQHDGATVIDLGLFDPRGVDFLHAAGFRGWSGSARTHVVLTEDSATPGYLPGPILPGTWHVVLGLYKVAAVGSQYYVEVVLADESGPPPYPKPQGEIPATKPTRGPGWRRGDLHCHTHHSDAQASVEELRAIALERGLDFVAVTDHNTISHHPYVQAASGGGLTLIPGQEVTTYYGHANVWGLTTWVEFRCRTVDEVRAVFRRVVDQGGLTSINHPKPGGPPWGFGYDLPFHCLEVWHGYPHANHVPLQVWEQLLQAGRRVVAVGGSDAHLLPPTAARTFPIRLGRPTTYVWASNDSAEAILAGIRNGQVVISCDVDGPFMDVEGRAGDCRAGVGQTLVVQRGTWVTLDVTVYQAKGAILEVVHNGAIVERVRVTSDMWNHTTVQQVTQSGYLRAQVHADENDPRVWSSLPLLALANPIYVQAI